MYEFRVGESYKSINNDGTYFYYKVISIVNDAITIHVYKDNDSVIHFSSNSDYSMSKDRTFFYTNRVVKLTEAELLAMIL